MEITLEKLQELIIEPEQMKEIAGIQEEMLDYSATIELMAKVVEARPIKPEEQAGLAPIDRISWFVRNAYIAGYMMAVDTSGACDHDRTASGERSVKARSFLIGFTDLGATLAPAFRGNSRPEHGEKTGERMPRDITATMKRYEIDY